MKYYNKIIVLCLSLVVFAACEDDGEYDHPIVKDNKPEVPILFTGATTAGFNPYYTVSLASGNIAIQISIPDSSPTQIKEVSKMIAGATGITPGNVTSATVANYLPGPISVNGNTVTINTTVTEFNTKVPAAARIPATIAAGTFQERAFMFLITLGDDTTVIPQQVRIRVTP